MKNEIVRHKASGINSSLDVQGVYEQLKQACECIGAKLFLDNKIEPDTIYYKKVYNFVIAGKQLTQNRVNEFREVFWLSAD